nr:hypothetical protein [Parachlamydiaceae bacterium]
MESSSGAQNQNNIFALNTVITSLLCKNDYAKEQGDQVKIEQTINRLSHSILLQLKCSPDDINYNDMHRFNILYSKLQQCELNSYSCCDKAISKIPSEFLNFEAQYKKIFLEKTISSIPGLNLPQDQKELFLALAVKFTLQSDIEGELEDFAKAILDIPQDHRLLLMNFIMKMTPNEGISTYKIFDIVESIKAIPSDQMSLCIDLLTNLKLVNDWMTPSKVVDICQAYLSLPESKRSVFLVLAKELCTAKTLKSFHIDDLANVVNLIPEKHSADYIKLVLRIKTQEVLNMDILESISKSVLKYPEDQMEDFFALISRLQPAKIPLKYLNAVAEFLVSVPNDLKVLGFQVIKMFHKEYNAKCLQDIFLALLDIPTHQDFATEFCHFKNLYASDTFHFNEYKTLIMDIVKSAAHLFTEQMNGRDRLAIFKNLKFAQLLIECGVDLSKKSGLATLSPILKKNCDVREVIKISQEFISKDMNLIDIENLLNTLADIPDVSRKTIIGNAKEIFESTMSWKDKISVILIFMNMKAIPQEVIYQFKAQTLQDQNWTQKLAHLLCLAYPEKFGGLSAKIIEKIKRIPDIEKAVTDNAQVNSQDLDMPFDDYFKNFRDIFPLGYFFPDNDVSFDFDFDDVCIDMPPDSNFADTDLIIYKDSLKGHLPLNGIKESEFQKIEA